MPLVYLLLAFRKPLDMTSQLPLWLFLIFENTFFKTLKGRLNVIFYVIKMDL